MKRSHVVPIAVLLLTAVPCWASANATAAAAYPDKPVRVVVPSLAGSTSDTVARMVAPGLSARLGHRFIVDNRAGANGLIGTEVGARATPDGYTLLVGTTGALTVIRHVQRNVPYDVLTDFTPIGLISTRPYLLAAHPSLAVRSIAELIEIAKARPGGIVYGSAGKGSSTHLAMESLSSRVGIELRHVPYKGSPQGTQSLVGGRVPLAMVSMQNGLAHLQAGRLRVLAITSKERWPQVADVPTVAEAGVPGFEALTWFALLAPARTPSPVVSRLSQAMQELIRSPDIRAQFVRAGLAPGEADQTLLVSRIRHDIELYDKLTRLSGVKVN